MRKVYFYIPEYPSAPTGGIKYHNILYEYFKNNYSGTYLSGNGRYSDYANKNKFFKILFGAIYSIKIPRKSVIVMSNNCFLHFFIPLLLNKIYKKHKYFLIVHHLVRNERNEFFRNILEKYFVKNSDKLVTVSISTKNELIKYDMIRNSEVRIIPPGLDKIDFELSRKEKAGDKFNLLSISTIEKRKGLIYIIEAVNMLKERNIILNIIGNISGKNDYYNSLISKVKEYGLEDKVFFRGRVSDDELKKYYSVSSAFIFPTLWEGYGMVAAESMAYGLPVIASDIPALEELIDNNINGMLFESGNSSDLKEKILILMNDSKKLEYLSVNAYEKSKKFKTWDETCNQIFSIIKESYF